VILERIASLGRDGYCMNTSYNRWRIDAMSAPLRDSSGEVAAAITLLGFDDDFTSDKIDGLGKNLKAAVDECATLI
ncbi:MAG TPA: IclR family transcriptional regulator C-terminal domain-containing protein, partial [Phycisphaerae bacterium]|nr:IclR family transcriptional regulator C-terminal domain-containing protein [Phycisphaerae bacterium]